MSYRRNNYYQRFPLSTPDEIATIMEAERRENRAAALKNFKNQGKRFVGALAYAGAITLGVSTENYDAKCENPDFRGSNVATAVSCEVNDPIASGFGALAGSLEFVISPLEEGIEEGVRTVGEWAGLNQFAANNASDQITAIPR